MSAFEKLIEEFRHFPGTGPRQARRFVYYLLNQDVATRARMAELIAELSGEMRQCAFCMRFFKNGTALRSSRRSTSANELCHICTNPNTNKTLLLVVERDTDADTIDKAGVYGGRFFVLGGTIPILDDEPAKRIRAKALISAVQTATADGLKEVVLAMSVNPEGENTEQYVRKILEPQAKKLGFSISVLGRGLSTGTELEYSDANTLAHALKNRA